MATRVGEGNYGNGGVGGLDKSDADGDELFFSTTDVDTSKAANSVLNQTDTSSQRKGEVGYLVDDVPGSCCQKVGDCFRSFWTTVKKPKTHDE